MLKILKSLIIIFCLNTLIFSTLRSEIQIKIVAKVGNLLVTTLDVQNEIVTNLVISKQEITQENINARKQEAITNLVGKAVKRNEIEKYKVDKYNNVDLKNYTLDVAKNLGTNFEGLKAIFKKYSISYNSFVENHKTDLLWNTLIFDIYKNQTNVNIIEVEYELAQRLESASVEYNISEIEISKSQYNEDTLNKILTDIKNKGFESAAKKYSISSTAAIGGSVGWVSKNSLSKKYLDIIKKINIREIAPPLINKDTVSILRINDLRKKEGKIDEKKLKEQILRKKTGEKLNLFSRSHFTNLKNSIQIDFQ
jgi:peptidyl-prolyl cis-trans isomerase SurA